MKAQYEPCEHRHDTTNPDAFYATPCPICEGEQKPIPFWLGALLWVVGIAGTLLIWWFLS